MTEVNSSLSTGRLMKLLWVIRMTPILHLDSLWWLVWPHASCSAHIQMHQCNCKAVLATPTGSSAETSSLLQNYHPTFAVEQLKKESLGVYLGEKNHNVVQTVSCQQLKHCTRETWSLWWQHPKILTDLPFTLSADRTYHFRISKERDHSFFLKKAKKNTTTHKCIRLMLQH